MRLSFGNFASGVEMEVIPAVSISEHHPKCKAPLKNSEEQEGPAHTVWSPTYCPHAEDAARVASPKGSLALCDGFGATSPL